jgi:Tfp pilus assembly protein PilF
MWRKDRRERFLNFLFEMERIQKIKDFLEQSPEDSFLQHALALEYIKIGDDMAAKSLFELILQREPGYVGSYYHLAKLLERNAQSEEAIKVYEKGMTEASKAGDDHAYAELRSAYEELIY